MVDRLDSRLGLVTAEQVALVGSNIIDKETNEQIDACKRKNDAGDKAVNE
jgi:hypothetical protein